MAVWLTFSHCHELAIRGSSQAGKSDIRDSKASLLSRLSVLIDHLVVNSVYDVACLCIPKQILMSSRLSIVSIDQDRVNNLGLLWVTHYLFLLQLHLGLELVLQTDEMVVAQLVILLSLQVLLLKSQIVTLALHSLQEGVLLFLEDRSGCKLRNNEGELLQLWLLLLLDYSAHSL